MSKVGKGGEAAVTVCVLGTPSLSAARCFAVLALGPTAALACTVASCAPLSDSAWLAKAPTRSGVFGSEPHSKHNLAALISFLYQSPNQR